MTDRAASVVRAAQHTTSLAFGLAASTRGRELPLTRLARIRTMPRLFAGWLGAAQDKALGPAINGLGAEHPEFRFMDRALVFTETSRSIVGRAAMWLAATMLLWPAAPQRACACEHLSSGSSVCGKRTGDGRSLCCQTSGRSPCCCKSIPGRNSTRACCRSAASVTGWRGNSCRCGSACTCHVSQRPDSPSENPATSTDGTNRRVELGRLPQTVVHVANADLPAGCDVRLSLHVISVTAKDRCRMLSRFTI